MGDSAKSAESEKLEELFSEECPALGTRIIMLKTTWELHILNARTGKPYMRFKQDLIKRAVKSITNQSQFFRLSDYKEHEWFSDYACPDFLPMHKALRLCFKRLDSGHIILSSAYKVPTGVFSYA